MQNVRPPLTEPQSFSFLHAAAGCGCLMHSRRRFAGGLLAAGAAWVSPGVFAREGVQVGKKSEFLRLVPVEEFEQGAIQAYVQKMQQSAAGRVLEPDNHPQVIRLRAIAQRIIPFCAEWNPRANQWRWEVNLIRDGAQNAFCYPGGKIAFFSGILEDLQLSDAEVAMIMGHEMAHALREHSRERKAKAQASRSAIDETSDLFGMKGTGRPVADDVGKYMNLRWNRDTETDADLVGIELAARAGYDPRAGATLWQKMGAGRSGAPREYESTHPSDARRIRELEAARLQVQGLYDRAPKPDQDFGPPRSR